jgi:hypothetical protein
MKILVCPKCKSIPKVYYGCRKCGSFKFKSDQLIHHYKCAYIGPQDDFGVPPICPKCRRLLTPGSDFEHLRGLQTCGDCGWQDMDKEFIANCEKCDLIFPLHQAIENDT